jgi:glutathione synthase/RimK-type ligase-like ATP-grasp enzyme
MSPRSDCLEHPNRDGSAVERRARLAAIDAALAGGTDNFALRFERARTLDSLGFTDAAREALLELLARDCGHAATLNELGRLLDRTSHHTAARLAFARAVALHPDDPAGHGNLGIALLDAGETAAAAHHFETAVQLDPGNVPAHQCLAILHLRNGDEPRAKACGAIGFRSGASVWPYRGDGQAIPLLVLHSALGGNVSTEYYLDDRIFEKWTLVAEFADTTTPLPPHALVFNAIGDADRCHVALDAAAALLRRTTAPVVNRPQQVKATSRCANGRRLAGLPGVVAPPVAVRSRDRLMAADAPADLAAAGFAFPLIVRAPGFHTGQHCVLVDDPRALRGVVAELPGDELLVIAYVATRRADALVRKYRVMIVGDALFPLHLAISSHWKVHYFSADMAQRPEHRAEEERFLTDMPGVLGPRAVAALGAIRDRLGLEYGGIDFGLDERGDVVVFEANATMIVPPPPPEACWSYRRGPVERIHAAVKTLLVDLALGAPVP